MECLLLDADTGSTQHLQGHGAVEYNIQREKSTFQIIVRKGL